MFLWEVFFFKESIMQKGSLLRAFLNKAILWLFWTTICGYFVYIVWVLKCASSWQLSLLLQGPKPGCPVSLRTEPSWVSGANLELTSICALHSHPTLYGSRCHFLSDGVSYSDGCTGEWLLSFLFNFVLLFDGRWDEILVLSAPIQLKRILDLVFPFKVKEQGMY